MFQVWCSAIMRLMISSFYIVRRLGTAQEGLGAPRPTLMLGNGPIGQPACIVLWNGGIQAKHPAGGPYTHVNVYFEPSLGQSLEPTDKNPCIGHEYRTYIQARP